MISFAQWEQAELAIRKRRERLRETVTDNRQDKLFYDDVFPDFAYRCTGFSMEETFRDGDLVFIHEQSSFADGQIVALRIAGGVTLKRLYKLPDGYRLVPDNPEYNPVEIRGADAEKIKIVGIAVGRQTKRG